MNFLPTEFNYIGTFFLSTDWGGCPLQGTNPYPTKREVRKIIDSNVMCQTVRGYMGVSKNSGTPKWMVYNGKPY